MSAEQLLRENEVEPLDTAASVEAFVQRIAQVTRGGAVPPPTEGVEGMTLLKATQSIGQQLSGIKEVRTESGMKKELEACQTELTTLKGKFAALGKAAETMKTMLQAQRQ